MKRLMVLMGSLLLLGLASAPVEAVPVLVVARGALGGNDFFDWGDLGPDLTLVPDGTVLPSDSGGLTATVSSAGAASMEKRSQSSTWNGNFAPGDAVLWTNGPNGPIDIEFSVPVFGAGAQIQLARFGSFMATINAYDSLDVLIATFTIPGVSSLDGDNSAIFLGVLDSSPSIARIEFAAVPSFDLPAAVNNFGINQLDVVAVPEPSTLLVLGLGLGALGMRRRRQSQS